MNKDNLMCFGILRNLVSRTMIKINSSPCMKHFRQITVMHEAFKSGPEVRLEIEMYVQKPTEM